MTDISDKLIVCDSFRVTATGKGKLDLLLIMIIIIKLTSTE